MFVRNRIFYVFLWFLLCAGYAQWSCAASETQVVVWFNTCPLDSCLDLSLSDDVSTRFEDEDLISLNATYELEYARPSYKTVQGGEYEFILTYPPDKSASSIISDLEEFQEVDRAVADMEGELLGGIITVVPNDYWYNHTHDTDPFNCFDPSSTV